MASTTATPGAAAPWTAPSEAAREGLGVLLEHEVYALLAGAGLMVPAHRFLSAPEKADDDLCKAIGSAELVVKIASPDVLHKSDVGGIAVCENKPAEIRVAALRVRQAVARDDIKPIGKLKPYNQGVAPVGNLKPISDSSFERRPEDFDINQEDGDDKFEQVLTNIPDINEAQNSNLRKLALDVNSG